MKKIIVCANYYTVELKLLYKRTFLNYSASILEDKGKLDETLITVRYYLFEDLHLF